MNKQGFRTDEALPEVALSVRQPWAWLLTHGHKDIENRTWPTRFRGQFLIHASKGMTRGEYDDVELFLALRGLKIQLPAFEKLERGGIVGVAEISDCVNKSASPWFMGDYGFVVRDARPLQFRQMNGALGFFSVKGRP